MPSCDLVLVAGGKSTRFNSDIPKQFQKVLGVPLYMWSLETFLSWPSIGNTVFVVPEDWIKPVQESFKALLETKPIYVVSGGPSRRSSSENGLRKLASINSKNRWVAVHDAARPCITHELLDRLFDKCLDNEEQHAFGGAVPGIETTDTIKTVSVTNHVHMTLPRDGLRVIQTPQILRKEHLFTAMEEFARIEVPDDSSLIEKLGRRIVVVDGSYDNLKVTFNEDIDRVSSWLRKRHP